MAKHAPQRVQFENRAYPQFIRPTAAALAVAACFSAPVFANPTNPTVTHGTASFATAGNILNVTNSHNAIINWGSFSIGVNELTRFIQPSALSAVLNRVTGQDPSAILGALQSNGRVFLLNPNGIMFGSGAQINVAGLVASTLRLSDDDFLNNRMKFTDGVGAGSVVNHGNITGGSVYLVGNAVTNHGLITSPNGEVVLAAGNSVELVNPGTPNLRVEVVAPDNEARNLGIITAEAGRIGIYAGLIKQSGTISADSAVSEGGRIVLKSTKKTLLEEGSLTSARGTSGGQIIALSSMTDGVTEVAGKMDASGTAGNGGFIETSAAKVKIADTAVITAASTGGNAGTWLIDPNDFYISSSYGGDVSGSVLASQLNAYGGTNVSIVSDSGMAYGSGNIYVNDTVSWNSTGALTLIARNNVEVNNAIANGGTGGVNLYAGWDGGSVSTPAVVGSVGEIILNAPISTLGDIKLVAGSNIVQGAPGSLSAANLLATSTAGIVDLANSMASNMVGTLTGSARGSFAFKNAGALTVGGSGISVTANSGIPGGDASINLSTTSGSLTINGSLYAQGGPGDGGEGAAGGNSSIVLASAGDMQINSMISAQGSNGSDSYYVGGNGGNGGNGAVTLTSGGNLTIAQSVSAYGGAGGPSSSEIGGLGGNGVVNATAAGNLIVNAYGGLLGVGGSGGGTYYAGAGRGGDGKIMMTAGGDITVASGRQIQGIGGDGGSGDYSYGGSGNSGGDGVVQLVSTGNMNVMGQLGAEGGEGGDSGGVGGNSGNGLLNLTSFSALTISGGVVRADGGETPYNASAAGSGTVAIHAAGPLNITSSYVYAYGAPGENGAAGNGAVGLTSSSGITISNSQVYTYGGSGNSGGNGGNATTAIQALGGDLLINNSAVYANGGSGYYYSSTGNGGTGVVNIGSAGSTAINGSDIYASGGNAAGYDSYYGGTGAGGNGLVLVSAGGGLTVSNSQFSANGGTTYLGQGGAAGLTMLAGGNIQFEGAEGSVYGGSSNGVGGDAGVLMQSLGGNIVLDSNYYYDTLAASGGGNTPGMKSVVVSAAGSVSLINEASVYSSGTAGIFSGGNVSLDNSYVYAESSASVTATGSLALANDSSIFGGGNAYIKTGGNVSVDGSYITGNPDVFMTVGGVVNIDNGGAVIAGAPTSIHLLFPMLTSGGFFINGIEGVVFDSLTGTGFMANGNPAVLGTNLLVVYGGSVALDVPTDALIVAMGESSKPPDPEKDKSVFEDIEEGKKKDAPVCR